MTIGERLRQRRRSLGYSLADLSALVGISKANLSKYERDQVSVSMDRLPLLAEALQTTPAALTGWDVAVPINVRPMAALLSRPRLGTIACGAPILAQQNIECYDQVPDFVKCDFTLVCKGDSMTGARILDGDVVCIKQQSTADSGQIAAVLIDGEFESEATLKRVRYLSGGIALWPENPAYEPLIFMGEEANRVHVLGVATHLIGRIR